MHAPRTFRWNNAKAFFSALLVLTVLSFRASVVTAQQGPEIRIKRTSVLYVNPSNGSEMYSTYCAACHGRTGEGNGPAAPAFKRPPTNLTLLTRNNGGKFPVLAIQNTLVFGTTQPHENIQMPVWNNLFRQMNRAAMDNGISTIRIRVLTEHIKTLQAK